MRVEYYANGRKRRVTVRGLHETPQPTERPSAVMRALPARLLTAGSRFSTVEEAVRVVPVEAGAPTVIPTETMSIGGARATEVAWLRRQFGMEVVEEGSHGKVHLAAPHDPNDPVRLVARAATEVFEGGRIESAQPNFLRLMDELEPATTEATAQWALGNPGWPGVIGADIAVLLERAVLAGGALRVSGSTQLAPMVCPFSTRHLPERKADGDWVSAGSEIGSGIDHSADGCPRDTPKGGTR